ncbi:MAG TPA: tRNA uridine-5-carboxymethylaminomethyl(34) synthesis GTPase MnmE [Bacteroidia bacterium]|nr:tRNA uridine-5-carboxymethylaminomethyl(34) synthesis GTPase MnmE [Bacteroidia bacterium]
MYQKDTIIALATPPGIGAIGVIRLSGERAIELVDKCFFNKNNKQVLLYKKSHTISFGSIQHKGEIIDEVVVSVYKAPHSYTGENIIEISCHGSTYIQSEIINLFLNQGARMARAGEFTMRAFLNKKLALTQAEAVADVIASNSKASHKLAMQQMRGGFSTDLKNLRQQLIDFAALIELELDFSEEDVEFADRTQFVNLIIQIQQKLMPLIESFKLGNVIKNGVPVAIAGKPNAGKSTLLNALLNEERAIVSPIAGTTRDTIEEILNIDGVAYRFIDTAGLRKTIDTIEQLGVERSYDKIKSAEILLYVIDAESILNNTEIEIEMNEVREFNVPYLIVINKLDKIKAEVLSKLNFKEEVIALSAKNKVGIDDLKKAINKLIFNNTTVQGNEIITNLRHYQGLLSTYNALSDVLKGIQGNLNTELIAFDVRSASHFLGELTGDITNDDILGSIFTRFCIGK